jgi:hypothetical protein
MNGDGRKDILIGSFCGVPQWIENTPNGWRSESAGVVDKNGDFVLISKFWNFETEEWDETDRSGTQGHCSSVAAVDWDSDGDMDLLMGGYRFGGLFVRLNEGTAKDPKFATTNTRVNVGDKPVEIKNGIGAPRIVDWNGDGKFDIVIGAISGGVFLMQNSGTDSVPKFDQMTTLIKPLPGEAHAKLPKRVEAKDGQPIGPGSSFHVEPVDYDGDGDLDLLVGACGQWVVGQANHDSPEHKQQVAKLQKEVDSALAKFSKLKASAKTEAEKEELADTDEYHDSFDEYRQLRMKLGKLKRIPTDRGDHIWLFRRK